MRCVALIIQAMHPTSTSSARSRLRRWRCDGLVRFLLDQWFLFGFGIVIAISSQVQVPKSHLHVKEVVVTYLCVTLIFFITGCTLPTRALVENYTRWRIHLFVQVQCFLVTSAVVFGVVSACATNRTFMDAGLLVGLVFTGCVPTAVSSGVIMTRLGRGNDALTVVESTVGNSLGPFLTPLLVQMYTSGRPWYTDFLPDMSGKYGEMYLRVFKQLGLSVFLPMVWHGHETNRNMLMIPTGRRADRPTPLPTSDTESLHRMAAKQTRDVLSHPDHLANLRPGIRLRCLRQYKGKRHDFHRLHLDGALPHLVGSLSGVVPPVAAQEGRHRRGLLCPGKDTRTGGSPSQRRVRDPHAGAAGQDSNTHCGLSGPAVCLQQCFGGLFSEVGGF